MNRNKRVPLLLAAAALVLAAVLIVIAVGSSVGRRSEAETLRQFYAAMYSEDGGGIEALIDCLPPSQQAAYYDSITMGGTSFSQLNTWRMELLPLVGSEMQVEVELLSDQSESAGDLSMMKTTYPGIDRYRMVAFRLTVSGSDGAEDFLGVMGLIHQDGCWYMTSADAGLKRVVNGESAQ